MSPRTIEQIRNIEARQWRPQGHKPPALLDPSAGECAPLFTSRLPDCLIHLTRYIADYPAWSFTTSGGRLVQHKAYTYAHGWCGTMMICRQVALDEATGFVCASCLSRSEELGLDTFGMIPDTGCAVSAGKRGRRRL